MRIAFDHIAEKEVYIKAVKIAKKYGIKSFSNYMLYNFRDSPKDLYDRLMVNIELNQRWNRPSKNRSNIYSYPMRYASIDSTEPPTHYSHESALDLTPNPDDDIVDPCKRVVWNRRFVRNIEVMKGAAHGSISPTPTLAKRVIGRTYKEFLSNLYMPEELLRNRNVYERKVYKYEPERNPGTGDVERFRAFIYKLLKKRDHRFVQFHNIVAKNSKPEIRTYMENCKDKTIKKWLSFYIK